MFELKFNHYPLIKGKDIDLRINRCVQGDGDRLYLPAYHFDICLSGQTKAIGGIDLRIGYTSDIVWYGGHIGYGIHEPYRGNHYAAKACLLLKPIAKEHKLDVVWITCNPDNWASRKTCEYVGCELIEVVDLPKDNDMYRSGERQKCRYRWVLY